MTRLKRAYGITAIIVTICSLFINGTVDLSVHDTYYVMTTKLLILMLAAVYGLFYFTLWVSIRNRLKINRALSWIHYLSTTIGLISLLLLGIIPITRIDVNTLLTIIVIIIVLAQIVWLFNLVRSLILKW